MLTTFLVTTTDDGGPGSLRQAILDANAGAGADVILLPLINLVRDFKPYPADVFNAKLA